MSEIHYLLKQKGTKLYKAEKGFTTSKNYAVSFLCKKDAKTAKDFIEKRKNIEIEIEEAEYAIHNGVCTPVNNLDSNLPTK